MSHKLDKDELHPALTYVEKHSTDINDIVNGVVAKYSHELDQFIQVVQECLQMIKTNEIQEYSIETLQLQALKLPTVLYFASDGLEALGTDSDVSEYRKKEVYNDIMEQLRDTDYTIPDKKATAEKQTEYESMVYKIYDRAYKKLKLRLDYGTKLLESIKKVLDLRIAKINKGKGGDEQNVRQYRSN